MSQNFHRQIVTSHSQNGVILAFVWSEGEDWRRRELSTRILRYPNGGVVESVNKAVAVFGGVVPKVLPAEGKEFNVIFIDQAHEELFDLIAGAEEPEQAFISRYVLEA